MLMQSKEYIITIQMRPQPTVANKREIYKLKHDNKAHNELPFRNATV